MQVLSLLTITITGFSLVSATSFNSLHDFSKRQGGDAFVPSSTPTDSCDDGWVPCGPVDCILPSRGDVCCSEGYGCPTGSFCLTSGYCCPNGEDPATCALNNGVTLSAGFNTMPVPPSSAPASGVAASSSPGVSASAPASAPAGTGAHTGAGGKSHTTSAAGAYTTSQASAGYNVPSYSFSAKGGNYTLPPSTTQAPVAFTGAAVPGREVLGGAGFVGVVAGVAALMV